MTTLASEPGHIATIPVPPVKGSDMPAVVYTGPVGYVMRLLAIRYRFDFAFHHLVFRGFLIQYRDPGGYLVFEVTPADSSTSSNSTAEHGFESNGLYVPLYQEEQTAPSGGDLGIIGDSGLPDLWLAEGSSIGFDEQTTRFSDDTINNCVLTVEFR